MLVAVPGIEPGFPESKADVLTTAPYRLDFRTGSRTRVKVVKEPYPEPLDYTELEGLPYPLHTLFV